MSTRGWLLGGAAVVALAVVGSRFVVNRTATGSVDTVLAHLPPGFSATHGPVSYEALGGAAHIQSLTLLRNGAPLMTAGEVVVSGIGAPGPDGVPERVGHVTLRDVAVAEWRAARVEASELRPAVLRAVFDPAAYPGGKPAFTDKRPVADAVEAHDVSVRQTQTVTQANKPPETVTSVARIGTARVEGVRMAPLASPPDYAGDRRVLGAAIALALAERDAHAEKLDIAVTGKNAMTIAVADVDGGAFDGGKITSTKLSQLTATGSFKGQVTLASMSGHDIDVGPLYAKVAAGQAMDGGGGTKMFSAMHLGDMAMDGFRVDAEGPLVSFDRLHYADQAAGAPSVFEIRNIEVRTSGRAIDAASRAQLQAFGMEDFQADFAEAGQVDQATRRFTLQRADLNVAGLAHLHVDASVDHWPDLNQSQAAMQAAVLNAAIAGATIKYEDHSLLGRVMKIAAAKQHTTPDKIQAMMFVSLMSLHAILPDQPDAAEQVGAFLQGQHSLTITATPPRPVTVAQLAATPAIGRASALGVHVSGN